MSLYTLVLYEFNVASSFICPYCNNLIKLCHFWSTSKYRVFGELKIFDPIIQIRYNSSHPNMSNRISYICSWRISRLLLYFIITYSKSDLCPLKKMGRVFMNLLHNMSDWSCECWFFNYRNCSKYFLCM